MGEIVESCQLAHFIRSDTSELSLRSVASRQLSPKTVARVILGLLGFTGRGC